MSRKIEHMDLGLFGKISKELGRNRKYLDKVSLHLYGEPLLHPRIYEMVSILKEQGIRWVEFSTNCTLLDEQASEKLVESGLDQVIFAIDGINPETYERIRVGSEFSKVVENVEAFFRIREGTGQSRPFARVQIIVMSETQSEIREFKRRWRAFLKKSDGFYIKKLGFYDFNKELICDRREGLPYRVPCELFPYKNLTVYADGRVSVCCYDWNGEAVVGDLTKQCIEEIWKGERVKNFFRAHFTSDFSSIPLCDRCEWTTKYCEFEPVRILRYLCNRFRETRSDVF